jgi:hypothetical protein
MALSLPATACRCDAWQWLVVASSAKQKAAATPLAAKQQQHHLETFTFPENLDFFKLIYSIYLINFSKNILATYIAKMSPTVELRGGALSTTVRMTVS